MSKLVIGSANFGMEYGFDKSRGILSQDSISQILHFAWENNIRVIDTAIEYGNSETAIGKYLKNNPTMKFDVITKVLSPINAYESLNLSLKKLNRSKLLGVLIHDFPTFMKDKSLLNSVKRFKNEDKCNHLGFSIYYPEQLEFLIKENIDFNCVQLAYSLFDQRFEKLFPILKERNVEIHVRSVFLQGLFFADTKQLGNHFETVKSKINAIQEISKNTGVSVSSLCLNFANNNEFIDKIIIGVDSLNTLKNTVEVSKEKNKVGPLMRELNKFSETNVDILFPHFWKL